MSVKRASSFNVQAVEMMRRTEHQAKRLARACSLVPGKCSDVIGVVRLNAASNNRRMQVYTGSLLRVIGDLLNNRSKTS